MANCKPAAIETADGPRRGQARDREDRHADRRDGVMGNRRGKRVRFEWRGFGEFPAERLYEMLRFRQKIFVVEQSSPFPDLDGLDQRAHHLLLRTDSPGDDAEDGAALAGYARLIPHAAERRAAIGRVAVAARWRRRGFARLLMQEALARCRRDYPDFRIALSAQSHLVPFYRSFGFRAISQPAVDYGIWHVEMELSLIEHEQAIRPIISPGQ